MPNAASRGKGGGGGKGGGKGAGGGGFGGSVDGVRWDCGLCGLEGNFAWRTRCRGCEAYRKQGQGGPLAVSRDPTLAEKQVRQQRQAQRFQRETSAAERKLRAEVEKLQGQLAASQSNAKGEKSTGTAVAEGGDEADAELDDLESAEAYSSWTEEERRKQIEISRAGLTYAVGKFGEASSEATSIRDEIAALERASRGAKPFKAHRSLLERRRDRLRAKLKKEEEELEKVEAEQEELQKKAGDLRSSMAEKNNALGQVEEELAELIKRALAEGDAAGEAGKSGDGGATAWSAQAASATLQNLASSPGIPPEFAMLLAHVHQAAVALAQAAEGARGQERVDDSTGAKGGGGKPPAAGPRSVKGGAAATGAAESAAVGQQHQQPQQQAGVGQAGSAASSGDGGAEKPAAARDPKGNADKEDETADGGSGGAMEVDVEEAIQRLPEQDREKLRAAIRGGARRRWSEGDDNERGGGRGREERERSPRPTKQNDADL